MQTRNNKFSQIGYIPVYTLPTHRICPGMDKACPGGVGNTKNNQDMFIGFIHTQNWGNLCKNEHLKLNRPKMATI